MNFGGAKLLLVVLLASVSARVARSYVLIEGNITLGALLPIHAPKPNLQCDDTVQERLGIQRLEGILHAIDRINEDAALLPGLTLGLEAYDTCASETVALDRSLGFLRGDLSSKRTVRSVAALREVAGVLGPLFSSVSVQVAHLFRLFEIPQVSFESTSYELSDKSRFEFFSRTVPHDLYQAKAIIDVARYLGWSYISVVHSDDSYGLLGAQALHSEAEKAGVCIATTEKLAQSKPLDEYSATIDHLLSHPHAKCVVVFCSQESQIRNLMQAVARKGLGGRFQWLGSDGWGNVAWLIGAHLQEMAANVITISPKSVHDENFKDYYMSLQPSTNTRNPWFREYWEKHFDCQLGKSRPTGSPRKCNSSLRLNPANTKLDIRAASAMDAVFVFAHALDAMQKDLCSTLGVLCERMRNLSGRLLLDYVRNVSFTGVTGDPVRFDANGDVEGKYDVMIFHAISSGVYKNVHVADWSADLTVDPENAALLENMRRVRSTCREACGANQVRVPLNGKDNCCWKCAPCNGNSYIDANATQCTKCPVGYRVKASRNGCVEIPLLYFGNDLNFSVAAMALSGLGMLMTVFVMAVFGKYNATPIVKASGRELSYMLLCGILLCFAMTFVVAIQPSDITCISRFFGHGVTFTLCYASLFIKVNRISRIFNRKNLTTRPSLILPSSQLAMVVALVAVEVLILSMLILLRTPRAHTFYPTDTSVYLDCSISDMDFGLSQVYNFILICMCTVYAFKTRKIPNNFNEAKFIAFAMYSSCVMWLAFFAVFYMDQTHRQKPVILCISVPLIAFVLLFCMYGPKVYIIIFRPHRNVRKRVTQSFSLSSISQSNGRGGHKASFRMDTADMDDAPESSGDDILDRKRRSLENNRPQSQTSGCDVKEAANDRAEVERLIQQLKKELRWTREALANAQGSLRQRRTTGRTQEAGRDRSSTESDEMSVTLLNEDHCEVADQPTLQSETSDMGTQDEIELHEPSEIQEENCDPATPLLESCANKNRTHRDSGIDTASSGSYNSKPAGTANLDKQDFCNGGSPGPITSASVSELDQPYVAWSQKDLAWNRRSKSFSELYTINRSGDSWKVKGTTQPIHNGRDSVISRDSRVLNTAL